jgi:O-methyltransferase
MRRTLKEILQNVGYEIRQVQLEPLDADSTAAKTVKGSEYYAKWSTAVPIYAAWLGDPKFAHIYGRVAEHTIVSVDRCYFLYCIALYAASLSGDFAECGVYKGGTALLLSELAGAERVVHIFDSFSGLPEPDKNADNYYKAGTFADTSFEAVRRLLQPHAGHLRIHRGWMPGTFSEVGHRSFALVHVDVDLYRTAQACCEFFYPRLCEGGIFVFDDYGFPACRGEKDAVDEFFSTRDESPICLPNGQAFVIKQKSNSR